jgi:hypothetical protein
VHGEEGDGLHVVSGEEMRPFAPLAFGGENLCSQTIPQ